ncbi:hypothetical protein RND71_018242 [Anisodus tanguticus]|uniref:Uncharacterized protein n=1 Tax=Anisodus tanguticus TaxID=243964 RepID=A0AAE1S3X6_9SOLA|nr:hypothetical protein RND71_018242 [Anisodus tanguticus]
MFESKILFSCDYLSCSFIVLLLPAELHKLLEDAPLPFIMQHAARISSVRKRITFIMQHAARISSVRKRITSLNSLLKSIRERQRVEKETETKKVNDVKR